MKTYTQEDFEALRRDEDGYLRVPRGDWSGVNFGGTNYLIIADGCELGDRCKLGNGCELGNWCELGNGCELGDRCKLGIGCKLGNGCKLGIGCELGNWCKLGNWCELGNGCKLGNGCELECGRVKNAAFFTCSQIGRENRTAYAYCDTQTGEISIRAGCWFGGLDEFIERVKAVHGGTQHETDYLAFADFARARFARYGEGKMNK